MGEQYDWRVWRWLGICLSTLAAGENEGSSPADEDNTSEAADSGEQTPAAEDGAGDSQLQLADGLWTTTAAEEDDDPSPLTTEQPEPQAAESDSSEDSSDQLIEQFSMPKETDPEAIVGKLLGSDKPRRDPAGAALISEIDRQSYGTLLTVAEELRVKRRDTQPLLVGIPSHDPTVGALQRAFDTILLVESNKQEYLPLLKPYLPALFTAQTGAIGSARVIERIDVTDDEPDSTDVQSELRARKGEPLHTLAEVEYPELYAFAAPSKFHELARQALDDLGSVVYTLETDAPMIQIVGFSFIDDEAAARQNARRTRGRYPPTYRPPAESGSEGADGDGSDESTASTNGGTTTQSNAGAAGTGSDTIGPPEPDSDPDEPEAEQTGQDRPDEPPPSTLPQDGGDSDGSTPTESEAEQSGGSLTPPADGDDSEDSEEQPSTGTTDGEAGNTSEGDRPTRDTGSDTNTNPPGDEDTGELNPDSETGDSTSSAGEPPAGDSNQSPDGDEAGAPDEDPHAGGDDEERPSDAQPSGGSDTPSQDSENSSQSQTSTPDGDTDTGGPGGAGSDPTTGETSGSESNAAGSAASTGAGQSGQSPGSGSSSGPGGQPTPSGAETGSDRGSSPGGTPSSTVGSEPVGHSGTDESSASQTGMAPPSSGTQGSSNGGPDLPGVPTTPSGSSGSDESGSDDTGTGFTPEAPPEYMPETVAITKHVLNEFAMHAGVHAEEGEETEVYGTVYANEDGVIRYYNPVDSEEFVLRNGSSVSFKPSFYNHLRELARHHKKIHHRLCGDVHSHPGSGIPRQSPADKTFNKRIWRTKRNTEFIVGVDDGDGPSEWTRVEVSDGVEVRKQIGENLIRIRAFSGENDPKHIEIMQTMGE